MQQPLRFTVPAVCAVLLVTPTLAYAYIDPGTGSVVTTAILGFFAAITYTFRKYFYRLKDLLGGKSAPAGDDEDPTRSDP